jgi:hypothetical protein
MRRTGNSACTHLHPLIRKKEGEGERHERQKSIAARECDARASKPGGTMGRKRVFWDARDMIRVTITKV